MTPTDNISHPANSEIITSLSDHTQENSQEPTIWTGREIVPMETDSKNQFSSHSPQTSTTNKIENTVTTNLTEQTKTHDALFNPLSEMQIGLLSGFENIQNTFSRIAQNVCEGFTTFVDTLPFFSELKSQRDLANELEKVKSLPIGIQDLICSFIDPTNIILEKAENGEDIPDYLIPLTYLDIGSRLITNQQLLRVLSLFKNLETLVLPHTQLPQITDDSSIEIELLLEDGINHIIVDTIAGLKKLQHLNLYKWIFSGVNKSFITDDKIERMISDKRLTYLNIGYCTGLTVKGFNHIATCDTLEYLNLGYCHNMNDECLSEIAKITNLKKLDIRNNENITINGFKKLKDITNLKSLNISRMLNITDDVAEVISECNNIEYLDVSYSVCITNSSLESFSKLSSLLYLNLKMCVEIDDNGLQYLSSLTKLKWLDLALCSLISENAFLILEPLKNLEYLNIYGCHNINSNSLKYLYNYKKLKKLIIHKENCTDEDKALLKEKLPDLEIIHGRSASS